MDSNYTRIFIGNTIETQNIIAKLKEIGINAVVKNEAESARLGGFSSPSSIEVFVHNDELDKAKSVLA